MLNEDSPIVILGAGGHATVLIDLLLSLKREIVGIIAPEKSELKNYPEVAYLGNDEMIVRYHPQEIKLVNGVGAVSLETIQRRKQLFNRFKAWGYYFETLVHPCAFVANTTLLGEGVQIMAGVILQPNVIIGDNVIINTRASIDHDCIVGHHVHVAPGVTLSGNVKVGEEAHIGVGATLIQGITVGEKVMIRAGTTVTRENQ